MSMSMSMPEGKEGHSSTRPRSSSCPDMGMAATRLTDDLLVEILARVPAKSLGRFKCVSKHWLSLTLDRSHRRRLPRPCLASSTAAPARSASWSHPSNSPASGGAAALRSAPPSRSSPATGASFSWTAATASSSAAGTASLPVATSSVTSCAIPPRRSGSCCQTLARRARWAPLVWASDQAVSPHFHGFVLVDQHYFSPDFPVYLTAVQVFSSESGRWVHKELQNGWDEHIRLANPQSATVFLNGHLNFLTYDGESHQCLAAVDTEGDTWTDFPAPGGLDGGHIQQSQGRLHYASFHQDEDGHAVRLVVYVLEDYSSKQWILKHRVETSYLCGGTHVLGLNVNFHLIAVHPECNLIFFTVGWDTTFMCYDIDSRQVKVICNLEDGKPPYLPYVPLFTELQSLHT